MKEMTEQDPSTKLLTIINVQHARPTKRQRSSARDWHAVAKKAARTTGGAANTAAGEPLEHGVGLAAQEEEEEGEQENEGEDSRSGTASSRAGTHLVRALAAREKKDSYETHWASETPLVSEKTLEELASVKWRRTSKKVPGLGEVSELNVEGSAADAGEEGASIVSVHLRFR